MTFRSSIKTRATKTPRIARSIHAGVLVSVVVRVGVVVSGERLLEMWLFVVAVVVEDEAIEGEAFTRADDDEVDDNDDAVGWACG